MANVKHVVVDSGGFIRNAPLKDIAESVYTVRDVVDEIRDKSTRQRLQVLPYELKFREPSSEAIHTVSEFAKKTGDYRSLSAVDIRVIALVYQLEKENLGLDHIKTVPDRNISWQTTKKNLENPTEIAGFYLNTKSESSRTSSVCESENQSSTTDGLTKRISDLSVKSPDIQDEKQAGKSEDMNKECINTSQLEHSEKECINTSQSEHSEGPNSNIGDNSVMGSSDTNNDIVDVEIRNDNLMKGDNKSGGTATHSKKGYEGVGDGDILSSDCLEGESSGNESLEDDRVDDDDDDDDDDDGWITPSNIKQVKAMMGDKNVEQANVTVGCITTDFSMQNVLLQMGLNVISVDGLLIKRAKNYVLRCYACFKISTDMTREFCYHCGNQTLQRVSMTVDEDGSIKYFLSTRKPISLRGTKYSLPMPKGGKHACNPILVEDQKEAQQRATKQSKIKYDVMDPDYISHTSPFAPTDIHSRAGQMGIRGNRGRKKSRNPNENRKVYGRRK